jgi:AraC-like DNA-binding protein
MMSFVREPKSRGLVALLEARIPPGACSESPYPGLRFHRATERMTFRKTLAWGPQLIVVAQGRKVARFGDHELVYDPSRYLVVTGETMFEGTITEASPQRPFLSICLEIPSEVVAKLLIGLAEDGPSRVAPSVEETVPAFVADADARVEAGIVRLLHAIDDPVERKIVAPLIVEEIVFRLLRSDAAAIVRSAVSLDHDAHIQAAMRFIRENAARRLSVREMARHVAMSPSHFAHRFRAVARVTPMRYLKQVRLQEARRLLVADGLRIAEAAARVGYESASHFARDFKSWFGTTPGSLVRRVRAA